MYRYINIVVFVLKSLRCIEMYRDIDIFEYIYIYVHTYIYVYPHISVAILKHIYILLAMERRMQARMQANDY